MKKIKGIVAALALGATAIISGGALAACGEQTPIETPDYEYTYHKPFSDDCDDFMKIDGKLDEAEWQGQNKLVHSSDGVTYEVSTIFTDKGMYVGAVAYDKFIYWKGYNNFDIDEVSYFRIRVAPSDKKQTQQEIDSWAQIKTFDHVDFAIDAKSCRSFRETRFLYATELDGELNTAGMTTKNETKSLTAELFFTWKELGLDSKPNDVKVCAMWYMIDGVNQNRVNKWVSPFNLQIGRLETWLTFDENGYAVQYDSEVFGSAKNGPAATDKWELSDATAAASLHTQVNRTQIMWFKDAGASENFEVIARVKPDDINDYNEAMERAEYEAPSVGFMSYLNYDYYNLYCISGREFNKDGRLIVKTGRGTDGLQYFQGPVLSETVDESYDEDAVDLRMVKLGEKYFYFYKKPSAEEWTFWAAETVLESSGATYCGLFTNGATTFSNIEYTDLTGLEAEKLDELKAYVNYVNTPESVTGGSIRLNKAIVEKGGTVRVELLPRSGYILSDLKRNGTSIFSDVKSNLIDGAYYDYTVAEGDADEGGAVLLEPTYTKIPNDKKLLVIIDVKDTDGNPQSTSYTITDEDGQVFYAGVTIDSKIYAELPFGEITVGEETLNFSGKYVVTTTSTTVSKRTLVFEKGANLTEDGDGNWAGTMVVKTVNTGATVVNGLNAGDVFGTSDFDFDTENYTVSSVNGNARRYFTDSASENFAVTAEITTTKTTENGQNVPGISVTAGDNRTIDFKFSPYDGTHSRLYVNWGGELAISGFDNEIAGNGAGTAKLTIVRYDNNLFVYNKNSQPVFSLGKDGLVLFGDATIAEHADRLASLNSFLVTFFADAHKQNAFGFVCYSTQGQVATTSFDVDYDLTKNYVKTNYIDALGDNLYELNVTSPDKYPFALSGANADGKFINGAVLELAADAYDYDTYVTAIEIEYAGGTKSVVKGEFVQAAFKSYFKFVGTKDIVGITVKRIGHIGACVDADEDNVCDKCGAIKRTFTAIGVDGETIDEFTVKYNGATIADGAFVHAGDEVVFVAEGFYDQTVTLTESATVTGTFEHAIYKFDARNVTLNGVEYKAGGTVYYDADGMTTAATHQLAVYPMPGTKTTNSFVYSVKGKGTKSRFPGAALFSSNGSVPTRLMFMVASWENGGKNIIVDTFQSASPAAHDCVVVPNADVLAKITNTYDDGATFKIVKTDSVIELWLPTTDGEHKLLTCNADGTITLNGATCSSGVLSDDTTKNVIKTFLAEGAEVCVGFGENGGTENDADSVAKYTNLSFTEYETSQKALCTVGEHAWNEGERTQEPTCLVEGVKTFTCTEDGCSGTKTEPIAKLPHADSDGDGACDTVGCTAQKYTFNVTDPSGEELNDYTAKIGNTTVTSGETLISVGEQITFSHALYNDVKVTTASESSISVQFKTAKLTLRAGGTKTLSDDGTALHITTSQQIWESGAVFANATNEIVNKSWIMTAKLKSSDITPWNFLGFYIEFGNGYKAAIGIRHANNNIDSDTNSIKNSLIHAAIVNKGENSGEYWDYLSADVKNALSLDGVIKLDLAYDVNANSYTLYIDGTNVYTYSPSNLSAINGLEPVCIGLGGRFDCITTAHPTVAMTYTEFGYGVSGEASYGAIGCSIGLHEWSKEGAETPATCFATGSQVYKCSHCEATETRTIAKLSHVDDNGDGICDNNCGAKKRTFKAAYGTEEITSGVTVKRDGAVVTANDFVSATDTLTFSCAGYDDITVTAGTNSEVVGTFTYKWKTYDVRNVTLNGTTLTTTATINSSESSVSTPNTQGLATYYMPGTKTTSNFTYTAKGVSTGDKFPGVGIFTSSGNALCKLVFMAASWENSGKNIIVDVNNGTGAHDFSIIPTTETKDLLVNTWDSGITYKIVKTDTAIELYVPTTTGEMKALSFASNGDITIESGFTLDSNASRAARATDNNTKSAIQAMFASNTEICGGFGQNDNGSVVYSDISFTVNAGE